MNPALAGLLRLLAHSAPWVRIPAGEFRKLASDNQAMLEALDRDPLVLQAVRVDALYGLVTLMDEALESAASLRAPTLIFYGARERIIPRGATEAFIRRLPPPQRVMIYPQGHHTLLRDLNSEYVVRDVANWVGERSRYCAGDPLSASLGAASRATGTSAMSMPSSAATRRSCSSNAARQGASVSVSPARAYQRSKAARRSPACAAAKPK